MATIREKLWKAMPRFAERGVQGRRRRRGAAGSWNAEDAAFTRAVEDHAVAAPRAATRNAGFRERASWPARELLSFQNAAREKGDAPAVGRPEGKGGAVGVVDRRGVNSIDRPHPEMSASSGLVGDIQHVPAIRR